MNIHEIPSSASSFNEWMRDDEHWQDAVKRISAEYVSPVTHEIADAVGGVFGGIELICWQANELAKPMLHGAYKLAVDYGPFQSVAHAEADPALHALTVAAAAAPTPDFHNAPPDLDNHTSWPVLTNHMQREMATWGADAPVEQYIAAAGQQVGRNMILGMELGTMASSAAAAKLGAAHAREMLANMARGAASATESTTASLAAYGPAGTMVRIPHTAISGEGMQLNFAKRKEGLQAPLAGPSQVLVHVRKLRQLHTIIGKLEGQLQNFKNTLERSRKALDPRPDEVTALHHERAALFTEIRIKGVEAKLQAARSEAGALENNLRDRPDQLAASATKLRARSHKLGHTGVHDESNAQMVARNNGDHVENLSKQLKTVEQLSGKSD